jgi:hypothetical protein
MNVQDIISLMIVLAAFSYAGYHLIKLFMPVSSASGRKCPGCHACHVKEDLLNNIHMN